MSVWHSTLSMSLHSVCRERIAAGPELSQHRLPQAQGLSVQNVQCHSIHHNIAFQLGRPMFLGKAGVKPLAGLQELFLRSSCPAAALQMRKDLQQWGEALALAQQLDPAAAGPLARQYAQV